MYISYCSNMKNNPLDSVTEYKQQTADVPYQADFCFSPTWRLLLGATQSRFQTQLNVNQSHLNGNCQVISELLSLLYIFCVTPICYAFALDQIILETDSHIMIIFGLYLILLTDFTEHFIITFKIIEWVSAIRPSSSLRKIEILLWLWKINLLKYPPSVFWEVITLYETKYLNKYLVRN